MMLPGEQDAGTIGGDSLAAMLRDSAQRPGIRAIVLRVNTGGGSVFAAEIIREEIARIRAQGLPVVTSMGAVAASGGYYIAAETDRIYATPATVTGSIGVFAAFPTFERLLARGGVYTDGVATTDLAGGLRPDRPLNPILAESIQLSVDKLHADFIDLVARGRGLPREAVVPVADGRALSAPDALALGLIDVLGGLEDAVDGAAELAGIEDYELISIEPPVSPQQLLLQRLDELLGFQAAHLPIVADGPLLRWLSPLLGTVDMLSGFADPRHLYMRCLSCGGA
jgi:protease-4